ncbi:MAG TPA: glycogen debranching enzyme, partial [Candidatus Dorea intestinavium]|nr:glycogen debranching enzyme [Candidatus Dorea intestinavium]
AGFSVRPGFYSDKGATAVPGGVNFTIASKNATACELLLFHREEEKPYACISIPENYKIGDVYSIMVFGLNIEDFEYAYKMDGPYRPQEGLIFNKNNQILDPYAKAVVGQSKWGVNLNKNGYKARVVANNFLWGARQNPDYELSELIIYELHVRGFTKGLKDMAEAGTFAGLKKKIPYLKELGINAVELMPVFEFDELMDYREYQGKPLLNYWGYNTVSFFAPNSSYAHTNEYNREGREFKELIKELHENKIEVILDVVFNHTAEGNEKGPVINFKGVDNNIYYMLTPEGYYFNFSGTGNTMNCNHPVVRRMIIDCLEHWVSVYRIDGFRFDLASILGRDEQGVPLKNPPLIEALAFNSLLSKTKLIAEAWDAGGLYQVGSFPDFDRFAEWNGRYRDDLRSFLKGGFDYANEALKRISGSVDMYGDYKRDYSPSINFITCHDGFTLNDLYSYNEKHNEANGWNNSDGNNDNRSWNCGIEGETDNEEVLALRKKLIKNAAAVLFASRGTPMFLAGDEFLNTQYGNNNPYCQDNEISWLNWEDCEKNKEIREFFTFMIHFRKAHPVLRKAIEPAKIGLSSFSHYNEDNTFIAVLFAGYNKEKQKDDIIYIGINAHWEERKVKLPSLPGNYNFYLHVDTGVAEKSCFEIPKKVKDYTYLLKARSVIILEGKVEES